MNATVGGQDIPAGFTGPLFRQLPDGNIALQIYEGGTVVASTAFEPALAAGLAQLALQAALGAGGGDELGQAPGTAQNPIYLLTPSECSFFDDPQTPSLGYRFGRSRIGFRMTREQMRQLAEFMMTMTAEGRPQ